VEFAVDGKCLIIFDDLDLSYLSFWWNKKDIGKVLNSNKC
jgi:hypothetical protein